MWRLACLMSTTPWDDRILNLNPAQMDYMVAMYAKDHPDDVKLIDLNDVHPIDIYKEWETKLSGEAKTEFNRNPNLFLKKYYGWNPYMHK
jgi:hypothetical protein